METVFIQLCRGSLSELLSTQQEEIEEGREKKVVVNEQVDDHLRFSHLTRSSNLSQTDDMFQLSMSVAVSGTKKEGQDLPVSKLSKV